MFLAYRRNSQRLRQVTQVQVSMKYGLQMADCGLRTGYKTRTKHYGLGIKYDCSPCFLLTGRN